MLKEQVAQLLAFKLDYGNDKVNWYGLNGGQQKEALKDAGIILNLFKAEVDKLTVIDDGEQNQLYSEWENEVGAYFEEHDFNRDDPNAPENWDARLKQAQLMDIKKQLLDLMGE